MADKIHLGQPPEPRRQGWFHRGTVAFLVVSFGFSWVVGLTLFVFRRFDHTHPLLRLGLITLYMLGPALGAVVAQRKRGEALLAPLGVVMKPNRWWVLAWLAPLGFAALVGVMSLAFPGVSPTLDFSGLLDRLAPVMTPDQLGKLMEKLHSLPIPRFLAISVLQML